MQKISRPDTPIKAERKRRGLTQMQMADLCQMPQSTYAHIERVPYPPTLEQRIRLASGLNLSLAALERVAGWPVTEIPSAGDTVNA